ncbi:hypothetical protein [Mesorhizobium sangaii]|uniref:Putative nucleic acid-binding Zn-ribbon protein n=1 Tax=Mesorhizobium sangaii TaxID=505389 RepID=A0A841P9J9_9HYPH|nr:hypothetical protein [Mesorhizobium sangaii]MBB6407620.1 putative nucleic acid-binding Zn-ribbon protein [Mesorhizobium sangaii]
MVSAISGSSQATQYSSSSSSSNAAQEAALEKQIQDLEDQAKAIKDQIQAAQVRQDIAVAQAKLDALRAAESQSTPSAALRQAEFDGERTTASNEFWM